MAVAANVTIGWPSTVASIPAGWVRVTDLDTKYVRGAAAAADADLTSSFGAASHDHSSPSHTPLQDAHTHLVSAGSGTGTTAYNTGGSNSIAANTHTHGSLASNPTTATNQGVAITVNTASNDPPFRKVIWIASDGTPSGMPSGSYGFFDSDTLPSNWTRVEGNNFLKGADAAGDGTGTGGSSDSHSHTSPAHTHNQNAHTHTGTSQVNNGSVVGGGSSLASADMHIHTYTLDSATATNNSVTTTIGTSDGQPVFKKLNIIRNDNFGNDMPDSFIAIWGGTNASIPSSWSRVTAMDDYFIKGCSADSQTYTSGGSSQHNHTGSDCQPTQTSHGHTSTVAAGDLTVSRGVGTSGASTIGHTHVWTVSVTVATNQSTSVTINNNTSESAYPVYGKVIFIKFSSTITAVNTGLLGYLGRRERRGLVKTRGL